jgi:hypothetical protein
VGREASAAFAARMRLARNPPQPVLFRVRRRVPIPRAVAGTGICSGCGVEVDYDVCHCGAYPEEHGLGGEEHSFVPMGCNCMRAK